MHGEEQFHECDLFLLSSYQSHFANNILDKFAHRGTRNVNGWGLASYYTGGKANILRSELPAYDKRVRDSSREFRIASQAINSAIILGHLRFTSSGSNMVENNHPFKLNFLGSDWSFIHNGTALRPERLVNPNEILLVQSNNDSARIFEFLRKNIINYYLADHKKSIIEGCRSAYQNLIENHPGKYNIICNCSAL